MRFISTLQSLTVCLCVLLSFGSLSEEVIWEKNQNVLIKLVDIENAAYAHPTKVSLEAIQAFLLQISIVDLKDNDAEALFTEQQVKILSENLPVALAKASQKQAVVFSLSQKKSSLSGLFKREVFTAGAIFIEQDTLNLSLGDVHKERERGFESVYDPTNLGLVKYDFDYGLTGTTSLNKGSEIKFTSDLEGVSNTHTNQVSLALSSMPALMQRTLQQTTTRANNNNTGLTRLEVEQIVEEHNAKEEAVSHIQEDNLNKVQGVQGKSIEERFKLLEKLKQQGLISDQEYSAKRNQLLDEI